MARWTFPHEQQAQQAFLFDKAKIGAAKKFALKRQMNRARGGRVLERQRVAEHCGLFVSTSCSINRFQVLARLARVWRAFGAFLAQKLSRSQRLWQGAGVLLVRGTLSKQNLL